MNKFFQLIYLSMVALALFNCEPEPLNINLKPQPQKLVIFSEFVDTNLVVSVSRTFEGINKAAFDDTTGKAFDEEVDKVLVKNAVVEMFYKGQKYILETKEETPGLYFSNSISLDDNEEVLIKVLDPKTGLSANTKSHKMPSVSLDESYLQNIDSKSSLSITFKEPEDVKNWYMLTYYAINKSDHEIKLLNIEPKPFRNKTAKRMDFILFDDQLAKEGVYKGDLTLNGLDPKDTVLITFSNISEGYYNFLKARKESSDLFGSVLSEPFNYPTNINEGFGYFEIHTSDVKFLKPTQE